MDESTGMDAEPVKAEKHVQRWPNADYAYQDGYQHGFYAGQHSIKEDEKEKNMEGIASDRVNIHLGGGGNDSGASTAAVIAALGSRNQADISPAILASLGNRNQADMTPALVAALAGHRDHGRNDNDGLFGGGGGILGILALLGILRGRGGFGGGDDCNDGGGDHARTAILQTLVEGQGDLRAQIPTSALEIQNAICKAIADLALGTQAGLSNLKDSVQQIGALNLTATQGVAKDVATGTLQTVIAIGNDGDKTRALITQFNNEDLQRKLTVAQLEAQEARTRHHADSVEARINQTVTVQTNQLQAQSQFQRLDDNRFDQLIRRLNSIEIEQNQIAKAANANLIIGSTGVATGAQNNNPVNVR